MWIIDNMKQINDKPKKKNYLKLILDLAWTFFKIGAITFGGGYAMICVIEHHVVERKKWISHEDMLNIVAVAECTPGAIALNAASFIGAKVAGFLGAFFASLFTMLPSILIITGISVLFAKFSDNNYMYWAGLGMRGAVAALMLNAVINLGKFLKTEKRPAIWATFVLTLTFSLLSAFKVLPFDNVYIVMGALIIGIVYSLITIPIKKKREKLNTSAEEAGCIDTEKTCSCSCNLAEDNSCKYKYKKDSSDIIKINHSENSESQTILKTSEPIDFENEENTSNMETLENEETGGVD